VISGSHDRLLVKRIALVRGWIVLVNLVDMHGKLLRILHGDDDLLVVSWRLNSHF
jgi:hypothetical protein